MGKQARLDSTALRQRLFVLLASSGPLAASQLCLRLGVSQASFSRLVAASPELLRIGRGRRTRYALRRALSGVECPIPVYSVGSSAADSARLLCRLHPIAPKGFWLDGGALHDTVTDDLPWFLHDLRPAGFLGRLIPRLLAEEHFPEDLGLWSADEVLRYLTRYGWDAPGNLIVGDQALALARTQLRDVERRFCASGEELEHSLRPNELGIEQDARPNSDDTSETIHQVSHERARIEASHRIPSRTDENNREKLDLPVREVPRIPSRADENIGEKLDLPLQEIDHAIVAVSERELVYPRLAANVLSWGVAGSSAAGEQPKFLATRRDGSALTPVLVKFSPPTNESLGRRIADILLAEHLALELLSSRGIESASSQVFEASGRLFLEVQRFDRNGVQYRHGVVSLFALDAEFVGELGPWPRSALSLREAGVIDSVSCERIQWLARFGELIANNDMHPGNLSFFLRELRPVALAPVYDMAPMLFAPRAGHILDTALRPRLTATAAFPFEQEVRSAALEFWSEVGENSLISEAFRTIAQRCYKVLSELGSPER